METTDKELIISWFNHIAQVANDNLLGLIDKNATGLIDKEKSIEKFRKALED